MTTRTRLALVALAAAILVVAIIVSSSSSTGKKQSTAASSAAAAPPVVVVRAAKPVGGIKKLSFSKGARARFVIDSDVSDEVHIHGYDVMRDVEAGHRLTFDFPATKDGIFEIELEGRKTQIASLQVSP